MLGGQRQSMRRPRAAPLRSPGIQSPVKAPGVRWPVVILGCSVACYCTGLAKLIMLCACYAMCGTELSYHAVRCAALQDAQPAPARRARAPSLSPSLSSFSSSSSSKSFDLSANNGIWDPRNWQVNFSLLPSLLPSLPIPPIPLSIPPIPLSLPSPPSLSPSLLSLSPSPLLPPSIHPSLRPFPRPLLPPGLTDAASLRAVGPAGHVR
eukprot:3657967-Rhodomonas_salina.1